MLYYFEKGESVMLVDQTKDELIDHEDAQSFNADLKELTSQDFSDLSLVSFIGAANSYKKTQYSLNGKISNSVSFICRALFDFIHPRKLVIIGTSGSTWSEVLTNFLSEEQLTEYQGFFTELKNQNKNFTQAQVDQIANICSSLCECKFVCKIFDQNDQNSLLKSIINLIEPNEHICIDITHGYRFIPLIVTTAIHYLKFIKKVSIENVYYGQFECENTVKPILNLTHIIELNNWITSFAQFEQTNDPSVFTNLIKQSTDQQFLKDLQEASFKEKLIYAKDSIDLLKNINLKEDLKNSNPLIELLEEPLVEKLSYINEDSTAYSIYLLSQQYFEARDFLRAVIYLHESLMTRYAEVSSLKYDLRSNKEWTDEDYQKIDQQLELVKKQFINCKGQTQSQNYKNKDQKIDKLIKSIEEFKSNRKQGFRCYDDLAKGYYSYIVLEPEQKLFKRLNNLRNAVAHGTPSDEIINNFYQSEEQFIKGFQELSNQIKDLYFHEYNNSELEY